MKHLITSLTILLSVLFSFTTFAADFVPIGKTSSFTTPAINFELHNNSRSLQKNTFLSNEDISLDFSLTIAPEDIGIVSDLYLVAVYNNQFYMHTQSAQWQPWDGQMASLQATAHKTLAAQENLTVLNKEQLAAGEYLAYTAYKTTRGDINYNAEPAAFIVSEQSSAALHRVKHPLFLTAYLNKAQINNRGGDLITMSPGSTFSGAPTSTSSAVPTSQTNIQEAGVDEGDTIKNSNGILYALQKCSSDSTQSSALCLNSYQMQASPAMTTRLTQQEISTNSYNTGQLYLNDTRPAEQLVWVESSMQQNHIWSFWFDPQYWLDNTTRLHFFDISQPGQIVTGETVSLDGALVASRRIADQLYLITRKNYSPQILPVSQSPLPDINFAADNKQTLVAATDCYVPASRSDQSYDGTIVTITRLSMTDPTDFSSQCIIGNIETAYVSSKAIYLASSRYPYNILNGIARYDQTPDYNTEIHKFSLADKKITYSASGSIPGHLGWSMDKKPFRMGESNDILKVATSLGESWTMTSRTRVSVLKEDTSKHLLQEISYIDNLGKAGEKLYAARFIGNRGYLVTFRVTDPLYMLDFSEPENPQVLGELNINGYSDYLHPIGDNYLLGIGKDAIADENTDRGAWYQGIKLSLFDVSSAENLHEVQSIIIGKRGSSSEVLYDHHALAWLPSTNADNFRLAIPVSEHTIENENYDYSRPSASYQWTQSGAYVFDINIGPGPSLQLAEQLITESRANGDQQSYSANERLVLQGDALHFIHNAEVHSTNLQ